MLPLPPETPEDLSPARLRDPSRRRLNRKRAASRRYAAQPVDDVPPARFTPLRPDPQCYRDPWTVRSLRDLFSIYLPEISISAGAMIGSGFLAAQIYRRWVIDAMPLLAPATYAAALGVVLSSIYIRGKFYPSPVTRARIRSTLLISLLLLGLHSAVYFVLRAAG
jgi:hypothetical protein